ncbi:hypothetical protein ACLOAV_001628 [Pseudogymnoascus australis]
MLPTSVSKVMISLVAGRLGWSRPSMSASDKQVFDDYDLLRSLRNLEELDIDFDDSIMAVCDSEPWFAWDKMAKGISWTGLKSITLPGGTQPFMESFLQKYSKTLQTNEIRPVVLEGSWLGLFKVGRGLQLQSIVLPVDIYIDSQEMTVIRESPMRIPSNSTLLANWNYMNMWL